MISCAQVNQSFVYCYVIYYCLYYLSYFKVQNFCLLLITSSVLSYNTAVLSCNTALAFCSLQPCRVRMMIYAILYLCSAHPVKRGTVKRRRRTARPAAGQQLQNVNATFTRVSWRAATSHCRA